MKTKNSLEAQQLIKHLQEKISQVENEVAKRVGDEGYEDKRQFIEEYIQNQKKLEELRLAGKEGTKPAKRLMDTLDDQGIVKSLIDDYDKLIIELNEIEQELGAHSEKEASLREAGETGDALILKKLNEETAKLMALLSEEGCDSEAEFLISYEQKRNELDELRKKSGALAKIKRCEKELEDLEKIFTQQVVVNELRDEINRLRDSLRVVNIADPADSVFDINAIADPSAGQDESLAMPQVQQEVVVNPEVLAAGQSVDREEKKHDEAEIPVAAEDTEGKEKEVIKASDSVLDVLDVKADTAATPQVLPDIAHNEIEDEQRAIAPSASLDISAPPSIAGAVVRTEIDLSSLLMLPELEDSIKSDSSFEVSKCVELHQRYAYLMSTMPECAEKTIAILSIYFDIIPLYTKVSQTTKIISSDELRSILDKLKTQLSDEFLADTFVNHSIHRIELLSQNICDSYLQISMECLNLLKHIQPVDIDLMLSYIDRAVTAAERIKGKDIFLLLGGTGTGKTTTIHFLAGSKMSAIKVKGLKHIEPTEVTHSELATFVTSPFSRSETRSINSVFINAAALGAQKVSEVVLCDTPGFYDTEGAEIDIANGIGVVRAVRGCQSVRPIVLVSQQSIGDRSEGLTKLAGILVAFISNIKQELKSFNYVFTKYSKEDREDIHQILLHKLSALTPEEKSSSGFVELLSDMVEKTKEGALILDPVNDSPAEILDALYTSAAITDPKDSFRDFATPESLAKLKEQLYKHKISIEKALEQTDIPLLSYKINQMALINENVIINESQRLYEKCMQGTADLITNLLSQVNQRLIVCSDINNISVEADIEFICCTIFNLYSLESIRKNHLPHLSNLEEASTLSLQRYYNELHARVISNCAKDAILEHNVLYSNIADLDKLQLLITKSSQVFAKEDIKPEFFNQLQEAYSQACKKVEEQYDRHCQLAEQALLAYDFDNYVDNMKVISIILNKYNEHLDSSLLQQSYLQLIERGCELLIKAQEQVKKALVVSDPFKDIGEEDLKKVKTAFETVNKISRVHGIDLYISEKLINETSEKIKENLLDFVGQVQTQLVMPICNEQQIEQFDKLHSIVKKLDCMRENTEIQYITSAGYQDIVKVIKGLITTLHHGSGQYLNWLAQSALGTPLTIDYNVLRRGLHGLSNAIAFSEHSEKIYSGELDELKLLINQFIQRIKTELPIDKLQLDAIQQLQKLLEVGKQLDGIVECEKIVSPQTDLQDKKRELEQKVKQLLAEIQIVLSKPNILHDISRIKTCMDFIETCSVYGGEQYHQELSELLTVGEQAIKQSFDQLRQDLEAAHTKTFVQLEEEGAELQKLSMMVADSLTRLADIFTLFDNSQLKRKEGIGKQQLAKTIRLDALIVRSNSLFELCCSQAKAILDSWIQLDDSKIFQHQSLLIQDESDIKAGISVQKVPSKFIVANELKLLDRILPQERSYTSILANLELAMRTQKMAKASELEIVALGGDYKEAVIIYEEAITSNPDLKPDLDAVIGKIFISAIEQSKGTLAKTKGIVIDETSIGMINIILTEFSKLKNANTLVAKILPKEEKSEKEEQGLSLLLQEIEQVIQERIDDYTKLLYSSINENRFNKAEACFKVLRLISSICSDDKMQAHCQIFADKIVGVLKDAQEQLNKSITDNIEIFSKLDITDFAKNSPVILMSQLADAGISTFGFDYNHYRETLKQNIIKKILNAIEDIKKDPASSDNEAKIKLITEIAPYLPADLPLNFASQLEEIQELIKQKTAELRRMLDEHDSAKELRKIVDYLYSYLAKAQYTYAYDVCQHINKLIKQTTMRFKADLEKGDMAIVLKSLPESWDDWWYYKNRLVEICRVNPQWHSYFSCNFIDAVINEMTTSIAGQIAVMIKGINFDASSAKSSYKWIQTHFEQVKALLNLVDEYEDFIKKNPGKLHLFDDLEKENSGLKNGLLALVNNIGKFIANNQQTFITELSSPNLTNLREILELSQEFGGLIENMQNYASGGAIERLLPEVKNIIQGLMSYDDMRQKLAAQIIQLKSNVSVALLHNPQLLHSNHSEVNDFYKKMSSSYGAIVSARIIAGHIDEKMVDLNSAEQDSKAHIVSELAKIRQELQTQIGGFPYEESAKYKEFNLWLDNLRSFKENFDQSALVQEATSMLKDIERSYELQLKNLKDSISTLKNIDEIAEKLILLKMMAIYVPSYHRRTNQEIDATLLSLSKSERGAQTIATLGLALQQIEGDKQDPAMRLINDHNVFKSYAISIRNQKTLRYSCVDVIRDLKGDQVAAKELQAAMDEHDKLYWSLVDSGLLKADEAKKKIVQDVRVVVKSADDAIKKIVKLSAHLFAYWTLDNSDNYTEMLNVADTAAVAGNEKEYLLQPHAAQVISILRLLGVDVQDRDKLKNHLVQIGTGEGKSVTLAITASIFALMGYAVDCACYSKYLSQRDYDAFKSLFEDLGLDDYIHYGTFNKLSEDFINEQGDVREMTLSYINNCKTRADHGAQRQQREKILLIDEVDVFFSEDFYGNYYRPLAELHDETINNLIQYVWNNRHNAASLSFKAVSASNEFKACCSKFTGWESLIEEATKEMLNDLKTFEGHDYVVMSDKIGYKDQDEISFNMSYGYKTLFAYFKEHAAGNITKGSLDRQKAITINTGIYSYAEVPKRYKFIMGVTGTLATLSAPEKEILRSYGIEKSTYMPSVYGGNQLDFAGDTTKDVVIESSNAGYFRAIANEISKRLEGRDTVKRAVLVFFKNKAMLDLFCQSSLLTDLGIKDKVKLITEQVSNDEKEGLIAQAAVPGSITLLTAEFGRGTDFKCYDDRMNAAGGVHVIQTFVSDSLSEEVQIKGRTARQGNVGSFSMVLLGAQLERFGITDEGIQTMRASSSFYTTINQKRVEFFEKQFPESIRNVEQILKDHSESEKFIQDLLAGNLEGIKKFLKTKNQFSIQATASSSIARTICLMDATGSMSDLLTKAKHTVRDMFNRACDVLKEKGLTTVFELQFVVYRNYNCDEGHILQYSGWESDPRSLQQFMGTIEPAGGLGTEAIEVGLWHVNQIAQDMQVQQVILIGDMPPNSRDEVTQKREENHGASYWHNSKFSSVTHVDDELIKIREKKIPIHAFYVKDDAKASFEAISASTGATSGELDINSSEGAERLTQVVTERILENLGGIELVELYRQKYVRGYVGGATRNPVLFSQKASDVIPRGGQSACMAEVPVGVRGAEHKEAKKF